MLDAAAAPPPLQRTQPAMEALAAQGFLFATGIGNSAPVVGDGRRRDQFAETGFHLRWREDFALVRELGCGFLRYGPQLHTAFRGPGWYDWSFADETFAELRRLRLVPIVDLCHFGVPDWIGDFQNPEFPDLFAAYARAFARRFPWVRLYTPVNDMSATALFSARHGWWNERRADDRSYVTAIRNVVRANVLAMRAILEARPDAVFIHSESTGHFHPECPRARPHAERRNAERLVTLDLNYGRRVCSSMYEFLMDNGMRRADYHFFLRQDDLRRHRVMGGDWYATSEHLVGADGSGRWAGEVFGYDTVTREHHERYRLPAMHTGTSMDQGPNGDEAERWLWKQWSGLMRLRQLGVPMLGFTWHSLIDQVDRDAALREANGRVNPRGLYDLDRRIRPAGRAYQRLIAQWGEALRREDACLRLPLAAA
jgi:beta-glucosidase